MCQTDVNNFLQDVRDKLPLSVEQKSAAKAKLKTIKLDDPEIQKILQDSLEIVIQADIWESTNELKAAYIKGYFMGVAENIFRYRRVKGGTKGGIRGLCEALGWGKSQAYRAKKFFEIFDDALLTMSPGISAAKLQVLVDKQGKAKKNGEIFNPEEWLEKHKDELEQAKTAGDVEEMVGTVKAKENSEAENCETQSTQTPPWKK